MTTAAAGPDDPVSSALDPALDMIFSNVLFPGTVGSDYSEGLPALYVDPHTSSAQRSSDSHNVRWAAISFSD